jgi:hypothetical protein
MRASMLAFLAAGCAGAQHPEATPKPGFVAPAGTAVRIVTEAYGREHAARANPVLVPFGVNQNGTELILIALDQAAQRGAAFLGDLQVIVTFRWSGTAIECRSPVAFAGDAVAAPPPAPAAEPAGAYTTEVEKFRPRRVSVTATETELACRPEKEMVVRARPLPAPDLLSAENGRRVERAHRPDGIGVHDVEREVLLEEHDRCVKERVTRAAERYDYEVRLGFVPPDWTFLSSRYADGKLVQGEPVCYRIADAEVGKLPEYRLAATAYYRGAVKQGTPSATPSVGLVEQWDWRVGAFSSSYLKQGGQR